MYTSWQELEKDCLACRKCELCRTRTQVVFGMGKKDADVLFIGEAPGENEDLSGKPFVGRGGKLLDVYLDSINLSRENDIFIANIVKCRPPKNRDPLPQEQSLCMNWLCEQVRIMQPKIIVCLGRIAAQRIISPTFKVTLEHGKFIQRKGVYLMGTFHPAALLRNPNSRPLAQEDFNALKELLAKL